ncbi:MAG TPA: class I SAM-dependent methyltransferase [Ktedonobacterales bacterium]
MDRHTCANQAIWDAWSASNDADSDHARDEALVRAGGSSLRGIELAELGGEVAGTSLLHLLCNRGSDTLSWARLGATVTGVDFSTAAIARARALAAETGLPARFLQSDLFALPAILEETFDIVYASYGVLCWLPDLTRWAAITARYLRPGGLCYLVEMHPTSGLLAADVPSPAGLRLRPHAPYFHTPAPHVERVPLAHPDENPGKNGNADRPPSTESSGKNGNTASLSTWPYSLGEVITALAQAGLRLESLCEHPATFYRQFPMLIEGSDGLWRWPDPAITLPLLFSLRARK